MKIFGKILIGLLLVAVMPVLAQTQPILNSISYSISAQTWVNSETARVVVAVDATMNVDRLAKASNDLMQKISSVVPEAKWNIISFTHSKDQSGLLHLQAQLVSRLTSDQVALLTNKINSISKAGEQFSIAAVDYSPSLVEMEKAQAQLRSEVMQRVQQELTQLNKQSKAQYFLHGLNFLSYQPTFNTTMLVRMPTAAAKPMPVSTRLTLTANVVLSFVQPTT